MAGQRIWWCSLYFRTLHIYRRYVKERLSAEEVYKKIEADLLDIVNGDALPNKTFYENGCYVTRAMAQTLLAQVYLQWAGAPLNGGADYYGKAAQMALKVINDSPHGLIHPNGTTMI